MASGKRPNPIIGLPERNASNSTPRQILGAGSIPGPLGLNSSRKTLDQGSITYKYPGNVRVKLALFWLTNNFGQHYLKVINRAEEMLNEHGLGLEVWPSRTQTNQTTIQFEDRVVEPKDYTSLRSSAEDILSASDRKNYLVILFCQFRHPANGITFSDTPTKCWTTPMCLISPTASNDTDNVTLLHEVGHAAGVGHDQTSTNPAHRNFMNEAITRTTMYGWQIDRIAQAFFSKS